MKPLKYLLCMIFLLFYIAIGFVLVVLNAILDFLKTLPHVWRTMLGKRSRKQGILSNKDMVGITRGVKEGIETEIRADEVEKLDLDPKDMWVSYLDKWGNG